MNIPCLKTSLEWKRRLPYCAIWLGVFLVHCYYLLSVEGVLGYPDSAVFYRASRLPLTSTEFWGGSRPPATPLFYRYLASYDAFKDRSPLDARLTLIDDALLMYAQTLSSVAAWTLLAFACARSARTLRGRLLLFACPLFFSLIPQVALWNLVALSESLALSCFAVFVALWILFLQSKRVIWLAGIATGALAFAATRDTHAYLLVLIAGALLGAAPLVRRRRALSYALMLLAAWLSMTFAASSISADAGERWKFPLFNNMGQRILPDSEHLDFFREQGMPISEALLDRSGKWASSDERAFYQDPRLEDFRAWSDGHGKTAYMKFLILHPLYSIIAPVRQLPVIYLPDMGRYAHRAQSFHSLRYPLVVRRALSHATVAFPTLFAAVAAYVSLLYLMWRRRTIGREQRYPTDSIALVSMALISLSIPHVWLAWHGDPMEIHRHTVLAVLQAYLGLALLGLFAYDSMSTRGKGSRGSASEYDTAG